jgi:hypothetical protein
MTPAELVALDALEDIGEAQELYSQIITEILASE